MPVDAWGNRAEVIESTTSTVDRMNLGRPYEHETYGSMEMVTAALRMSFGEDPIPEDPLIRDAVEKIRTEMDDRKTKMPAGHRKMTEIAEYVNGDYNRAYEVLLDFYKTVSPRMYEQLTSPEYKGTPEYHVKSVLKKGLHIWVPMDTPKPWIDLARADGTPVTPEELEQMPESEHRTLKIGGVIGDLNRHYPARRGPLWFRGPSGNESVTVESALIAETYMLLLEKTGGDWSGVASAKHQHYGLPAKLSKQDKFSLPGRANPVRIMGEAEVRLSSATVADDVVADILEMSNSPAAHKNVCENILRAEQPSNIDEVLDRKEIPRGSNRAQVFVTHALQCAGFEFFYVDHTDEEEIYPADPIGGARDMGLIKDDVVKKLDEEEPEDEELEEEESEEEEETTDNDDD